MDHWFQMEQLATAQDPMLEGYTTLGFLAGQTERIRLGLLVTGVTYRHPGLLAKIVTTLDVLSAPRPLQQPHPPILVGGSGEKKTLRLVAQYADACNLFATGPQEVARKLDVLAGHCDAVGRDPAAIRRTVLGGPDPIGDPDGFLAAMAGYAAVGIEHVQVMPTGPDPVGYVRGLGERIVPRLARLGPA
jgi:alkanesulfonate monooxygenase SsuD/methylene tetrahydromethanopterin reductase-like flavin-dependent oxidoreductase (luciferase family)